MTKKLILILACCMFATSACNLIYKQNIQQGNAIEQDKLDQLEIGMTMNQVAYLMGTPAIRDPFHQSRWDYYYSFAIRGGEPITRLITLNFENALLKSIAGTDPDDPGRVITENAVEESEPDDPAATPEPAVITAIDTPVADTSAVENAPVAMPEVVAEETATDFVEEAVEVDTQEIAGPALWIVQLGAFDSQENADRLVSMAGDAGFQTTVTVQEVASIGTRYLVRTVGYESRTQAERQMQMINSALEIGSFLIPPAVSP